MKEKKREETADIVEEIYRDEREDIAEERQIRRAEKEQRKASDWLFTPNEDISKGVSHISSHMSVSLH